MATGGTELLNILIRAGLPRSDALDIISFASNQSYGATLTSLKNIFINNDKINIILEKLRQNLPVAYITGRKEFYGLEFEVNEHTLIPRSDTETLVRSVLNDHKNTSKYKIVDLCTGSGCVLLSLLHHLPDAVGIGIDISPQAVETAKRNAASLGLSGRAQFITGDVLTDSLPEPFDILTANPPYLTADEYNTSPPSLYYEPRSALVADDDGYIFYKYILNTLSNLGNNKSLSYFEIGYNQKNHVEDIAKKLGFNASFFKDLAGHYRVMRVCF